MTSQPISQLDRPRTLGELRAAGYATRSVKDEMRSNLIAKLRSGERLFPGIVGYDESVVPQIVNAILAKHNFILLGLRGQAKSRIIRQLTDLLDEQIPIIAGSEINDDPFHPLSAYGRQRIEIHGDETEIDWVHRENRFVEKLATPDVTIADIIGDVDPIKAAKGGHLLSDELTIHFGLLPRANRGIFAINELPDLAGKIQVGLFNIMQEGDVQIKGYPVRLPLDVMSSRQTPRITLHEARSSRRSRTASALRSKPITLQISSSAPRSQSKKRGRFATGSKNSLSRSPISFARR